MPWRSAAQTKLSRRRSFSSGAPLAGQDSTHTGSNGMRTWRIPVALRARMSAASCDAPGAGSNRVVMLTPLDRTASRGPGACPALTARAHS